MELVAGIVLLLVLIEALVLWNRGYSNCVLVALGLVITKVAVAAILLEITFWRATDFWAIVAQLVFASYTIDLLGLSLLSRADGWWQPLLSALWTNVSTTPFFVIGLHLVIMLVMP